MNMLFWYASMRTMQPDNQLYVTDEQIFCGPKPFPPYFKRYEILQVAKKYILLMHYIIEYQSQSSALLPQDLVQTYKLLVEARKTGIKFFAFYNCWYFLATFISVQ